MGSRRTSAPQSCAVVLNPTTGELTEAGFVSDLRDERVTHRAALRKPTRAPPGACCVLVVLHYCVVRPFLSVALPRGKWRKCPPETVLLVNVSVCLSVCQATRRRACDGLSNDPSIRCIASPAGSGDTGDRQVDERWWTCTPSMCVRATPVGFSVSFSRRRKRLPTAREREQRQACQEGVDDSVVWSGKT